MGAYEYGALNIEKGVFPTSFRLLPAYPNPFNSYTTVTYQLPVNTHLELNIYDIRGRKVGTLLNDFQSAGYYNITWDATSNASGVYIINMKNSDPSLSPDNSFSKEQKVILVK